MPEKKKGFTLWHVVIVASFLASLVSFYYAYTFEGNPSGYLALGSVWLSICSFCLLKVRRGGR